MGLFKTTMPVAPDDWYVVIDQATRRQVNMPYYDFMEKAPTSIADRVAVRLCRKGKERMTYATLSINTDDFEDQITTLKAEAEEKAAALTAVGAR